MDDLPGRRREQTQLLRVCRAARDGEGGLVMVTGEPGIGKTRLATALSDACSEMGMAVARGWCVDDPGAPALWPWTRLSRHVPALAACIDHTLDAPTEGAVLRLSDAVADILTTAAGHTGMCVVLEDLHWADSMSTDLLLRLVQDLGSTPIVVVATAREEGVHSAFGQAFERLVRCPNTEHATLTGLAERDVVARLDADEQLRCWAATLLGLLETRERVGVRPGGLSARELEVAHLVAQAMTNQQIADRLVLSVRTIESHVRSALARLGLASRTELAVWVRDHVDQADG